MPKQPKKPKQPKQPKQPKPKPGNPFYQGASPEDVARALRLPRTDKAEPTTSPEQVAEALLRYRPPEEGPKPKKSDRRL